MVTYRTDKTYITWKLVWILRIKIELWSTHVALFNGALVGDAYSRLAGNMELEGYCIHVPATRTLSWASFIQSTTRHYVKVASNIILHLNINL
jgi:hypothetical protein